MAQNDIRLFAEITKRDDEQRMVYGYASTEAMDVQGEIVRKEAIEQALPEYMKFANIREMHQPSAVGVAKQAEIDDKGLFIGAKVVDDSAWTKVKEGVYKGFSIGGKSLQKHDGVISQLRLSEISLVDRPANPEAVIELFKADIDGEFVADKPDIAKYANEEISDARTALEALSAIAWLLNWEEQEGEPPAQAEALRAAVANLKAFIASEILEDNSGSAVAMSEGSEDLEKKGARNSAADQEKVQAVHDHSVALGASCSSEKAEAGSDIAKIESQATESLAKVAALEADLQKMAQERDDLIKRVEALEALPEPPKGSLMAVGKGEEVQLAKEPEVEPIKKADGSIDEAATLLKKIHASGPIR